MSKSILVIDTPENCIECHFFAKRLCGNGRCTLNQDISNVIPDRCKPDWCPIRDLPRKTSIGIEVCIGNKTECVKSYVDGYNACIDEILKVCHNEEQFDD